MYDRLVIYLIVTVVCTVITVDAIKCHIKKLEHEPGQDGVCTHAYSLDHYNTTTSDRFHLCSNKSYRHNSKDGTLLYVAFHQF